MTNARDDPTGLRRWYQGLPAFIVIPATALGALAGGGLLDLSTSGPSALLGLGGLIVATLSALIVTDYMAEWRRRGCDADPRRGAQRWTLFIVLGTIAGVGIVAVAELFRWPFPAFVGLMFLTLVLGPIIVAVTASSIEKREAWMQLGMIASFIATMSFTVGGLSTSVRIIAVLIALAGLGAFTTGFTAQVDVETPATAPLVRLFPGSAARRGIAAVISGGAVCLLGAIVGVAVLLVAGVWLVLIAMIALSVRPARFGLSATMERTILWGGIGLVVVGGYQLFTTDTVGRSVPFLVFLVATITLAGAWIVWRGATLVVAVLVGFVFVWGMFSHTVDDDRGASASDQTTRTRGVVAFGDSFISGEGAPDFFDRTDQKGDERNECRRAPTAYPALVSLDDGVPAGAGSDSDDLGTIDGLTIDGLDFFACSGAKLAQVLDTTPDDPRAGNDERDLPCEPVDELAVGQYPCGPDGVYGSRLQVDHLPGADIDLPAGQVDDPTALGDTQLVLVSIGGNDVRFGDIVAGCLLPGSCAERREVWLDNVTAIGPDLTRGYERLRELFDPDGDGSTSIVVMPYPLVVTEDTCERSPLDGSEHEFIYEFTTVLNQQLAASARQAGVHYFADGTFAFDGHRLCEEGERAINLIGLQPTDGPLSDRVNPGSWTHNSMHPNVLGHRLTATALTEWMNEHGIIGSAHPEPIPGGASELLGVRTARPYAVAPGALDDLRSRAVEGCGFDQLTAFATRVSVFDEAPASGEEQPFRVPVAGADPNETLCVTDGRGRWIALTPTADQDADAMAMATESPTATIQDGRVFVTGGRPRSECPPREQDDGACAFQWILFSPPVEVEALDDDETPAVGERTWSLRAVRYCSTDPDCASSFAQWRDDQIDRAARKVVPTVALIFLGGWLLALGLVLRRFRPFSDTDLPESA